MMINILLQRMAVYALIGMVLHGLGAGVTSWEFWCLMALMWALELTVRNETLIRVQQDLKRFVDAHNKDTDHD